jgi:ABC-2 type transport system ATP-binding protein
MNGLQLTGISRSFGAHKVLHDVDLTVQRGEIVGFIGGNGAGKTTTMRLILGLLEADQGSINWDGNPITAADRRSIGYMPEERGLYPQMKIRDQLVHFALLEGHNMTQATLVTDRLIETLGLEGRANDLVQDLSLGNQQRVQLAAALVGNPALLVLDEPFSGLDPVAVETMSELIRAQAARGVGILFSSHQIELVERISDRVCVLDQGRVVVSGSVSELKRGKGTRWKLTFAQEIDAPLLTRMSNVPRARVKKDVEDTHVVYVAVDVSDSNIPDELLSVAAQIGGLRSIELGQRSLGAILSEQFISEGRGSASSPAPLPNNSSADDQALLTLGGTR